MHKTIEQILSDANRTRREGPSKRFLFSLGQGQLEDVAKWIPRVGDVKVDREPYVVVDVEDPTQVTAQALVDADNLDGPMGWVVYYTAVPVERTADERDKGSVFVTFAERQHRITARVRLRCNFVSHFDPTGLVKLWGSGWDNGSAFMYGGITRLVYCVTLSDGSVSCWESNDATLAAEALKNAKMAAEVLALLPQRPVPNSDS